MCSWVWEAQLWEHSLIWGHFLLLTIKNNATINILEMALQIVTFLFMG